ncbi:MarR family transcriptional regulator [Gordonibacter sp. An230]|uniref:MarR family winged helix-turn-helix transcriptional regulator n=1 Tax=Gordonibacter sp. An230 TaxID=1965592 RepID=UPI000B3A7831|nr:MarR family winged helix-turn-helix transcriptional regulator [Gordonibacter sp. An230]OUO90853.1 MarR family transcriptional regulator [Gordonibacter sp. An230]
MEDSFAELKHELYDLMQRMRGSRVALPIPEGVTPLEARTALAVAEAHRAGETRPGRIAELSHIAPSALSQTFRSLEGKGFIERHRAAGDWRGVAVALTPEGERLAAEVRRLYSEHMGEVMAYVGEEDVRCLVRILRKVADFHDGKEGDGACA